MFRKKPFITISLLLLTLAVSAQMTYEEVTINSRFEKTANIFSRVSDSIRSEFLRAGLEWPLRFMYIRSFKFERELEVWVKNDYTESFRLYKTYRVCAVSGSFGPKRKEGDRQIPEGFYYINEFRPNSTYHLALGLNYPNVSDQILSDPQKPGGDIYIHGNCVTIGCLPLTDSLIEQVYFLASIVKDKGQDFIPVHIYPYRFDYPSAKEAYLHRTKANVELQKFNAPLQEAYEYFEDTHQLPAVLVSKTGHYVIATNPEAPKLPRKKIVAPVKNGNPFEAWPIEEQVDKVPAYFDGAAAYQRWLFNLGKEFSATLPEGATLSIQVEFVVDEHGSVPFALVRGGNAKINATIKERFEQQLKWQPAVKQGKAVATKMRQNMNLVGPEDLD